MCGLEGVWRGSGGGLELDVSEAKEFTKAVFSSGGWVVVARKDQSTERREYIHGGRTNQLRGESIYLCVSHTRGRLLGGPSVALS